MEWMPSRDSWSARDGRFLVLSVALVVLVLELTVASVTYGTNDITHWQDFVNAVSRYGPVRVYGAAIPHSYYNHPPLMGYVLEVVNWLRKLGVSVGFSIRALASVCDVVCAMVVFALVGRRRGQREAVAAGIVVACSPVLFMIAAFHGNSDPIFTMLILLSAYLLVDRHRPGWAGAILALALGVKIVTLVALPVLFVYAAKQGRRELVRFAGVAAVVFLLTWGPALALEWPLVRAHVIDYPGLGLAQWGFIQFGHWADNPWWVAAAQGSGRKVIVAVCALVPALAVWRSPRVAGVAVAVALSAFMALTPAFAVQYLAWAAAATVVVSFWLGLAYNLLAGAFLLGVYNRWSGGFFATSTRVARYQPLTHHEIVIGLLPWVTVLITACYGLRQIVLAPREARSVRVRMPRAQMDREEGETRLPGDVEVARRSRQHVG